MFSGSSLLKDAAWAFPRSPIEYVDMFAVMRAAIASEHGITIHSSADFHTFVDLRRQLRGDSASPYFRPDVLAADPDNGHAFWTWGERAGDVVYLEAFKRVHPDAPFGHWLARWLLHAHTMDGEDIRLEVPVRDRGEVSQLLIGRSLYAGELWISPTVRAGRDVSLVDDISLYAMLLALVFLECPAVWGLGTASRARSGLFNRMLFDHHDDDYLTWLRRPACVETDREMLIGTTLVSLGERAERWVESKLQVA